MTTIHVDNQPYPGDPDRNLLEVCLELGFDLPYFCWHPAMGSVGACRQCAVKQYKDEEDTQGRLVMACMTPAADGTRIGLNEEEARAFRARVIEWLMVNHPHDCPVCEEGGECHLQDMTVMTGHNYRRFRGRKRTFRNQYLGPFINHEMNRCITCYRCVRFYNDYAGGGDLQAMAASNHIYFGRHEDGVLENEFSGNLVEVCPTGVFTDRPFGERYVRKWDLQSAPSVCSHCGLGCNTSPNERYGVLRRVVNRYNSEVNGYFLCDRGRFGYDFVNSADRLREPLARADESGSPEPVDPETATRLFGEAIADGAIGVGSPRASLEANYALRTLVGPDNFYLGLSDREDRLLDTITDIMMRGPMRAPSLREAEEADAVLVLGEDLTNTAPRLALALRQTVRHRHMDIADRLRIPRWQDAAVREAAQYERSPLYIATAAGTRLDDVAAGTLRAPPEDIARLGFAVARALDPGAPAVPGLSDEMQSLAEEIAAALRAAGRPLVVSGPGTGSEAVLQAAANVARALGGEERAAGELLLTVPECNSLGLKLMTGGTLEAAFERVRRSGQDRDTVVVLENDLYRRAAEASVNGFLDGARRVVVLDYLQHDTVRRADLALPAAALAEGDGTLVNNEGRAQRFFQVYQPPGAIQESWRWLRDAMQVAGREPAPAWSGLDDVTAACANELTIFEPIPAAAPGASFRIASERVSRAPHRYSGRTAMRAHLDVHEHEPPRDPDAPFTYSMEGYYAAPRLPAALIPYFWSPGWNSEQAVNKFQDEIGGRLHGGVPGVRLIEPKPEGGAAYYTGVPKGFEPRRDAWCVVALHHIFGSEELSVRAPAVAERVPAAYVALHPRDAEELSVGEGDPVAVALAEHRLQLPVRYIATLPRGTAGLPVGLPGLGPTAWSDWARIETRQAPA